jgi:DNA mismatch endonuclease, patch repair protein
MTDVVNAKTRSRMMAGIRSANTKPEKQMRSALHRRGFRFARGSKGLEGKPDIVLPKWNVAVFVNGCFWHFHKCQLSKIPNSNTDFWARKLQGNQKRDYQKVKALVNDGWKVATVWECALRSAIAKSSLDEKMDELAKWIRTPAREKCCTVSGSGLTYHNEEYESN